VKNALCDQRCNNCNSINDMFSSCCHKSRNATKPLTLCAQAKFSTAWGAGIILAFSTATLHYAPQPHSSTAKRPSLLHQDAQCVAHDDRVATGAGSEQLRLGGACFLDIGGGQHALDSVHEDLLEQRILCAYSEHSYSNRTHDSKLLQCIRNRWVQRYLPQYQRVLLDRPATRNNL
jgi:hypothetical protein